MARIDLPESRLRLRKRRRRLRLTAAAIVFLLLVLSGLVGLTYWPALRIADVAVSGTSTLSSSTLEAFVRERLAGDYWYILPKSNIFLYPKAHIEKDILSAYPVLASADVHAADFHTVEVGVIERQPRALWCSDTCYFMDENGVVYGEAPIFSEPVYTVYVGSTTPSTSSGQASGAPPWHYLTPTKFQALLALVDAVIQKLSGEVLADVSINADNDVGMRFAGGFVLKFALHEERGDTFERLTLALTAEPFVSHKLVEFEYLDLRFGDKLYYKLRD